MPGTTPVYGFPYPEPTDLVADYPALGQQLAEDIEDVLPTLGGLTLISPVSIANSGGSASTTNGTTSFTGVTSISLNNVFSSTYGEYRIIVRTTGTADAGLRSRYRVSGTDETANSYLGQAITASAANAVTAASFGGTSVGINAVRNNLVTFTVLDISQPNATVNTTQSGVSQDSDGSSCTVRIHTGRLATTTAYTGITLFPESGNITGFIRVYGYKGA